MISLLENIKWKKTQQAWILIFTGDSTMILLSSRQLLLEIIKLNSTWGISGKGAFPLLQNIVTIFLMSINRHSLVTPKVKGMLSPYEWCMSLVLFCGCHSNLPKDGWTLGLINLTGFTFMVINLFWFLFSFGFKRVLLAQER